MLCNWHAVPGAYPFFLLIRHSKMNHAVLSNVPPPTATNEFDVAIESETHLLDEDLLFRQPIVADIRKSPAEHDAVISDDNTSPRHPILSALAHITIEPALFMYAFAYSISAPVFSYMMMNKLCLEYCAFSDEQCNAYGTGQNATVDTSVQKVWAQFDNYSTIISTVPSVIFALFMGPWSDIFGRKTPMAVPFVGAMLASVFTMLLYFVPSLPVWVLFLPQLMHSLMGGLSSLLTGAFSYAADLSTHGSSEQSGGSRTIRITLIEIAMALGFASAGLISGALISRGVDYYVCYLLTFTVALSGFAYVIVRVRETRRPDRAHTPYEAFLRLFRIHHLVDSCRTMAKPRLSTGPRARRNLWLLLAAITVFLTIFMGEMQINQKFFTATPLRWSLAYYVSYHSAWTFISMIFLGVFIGATKRLLKWRDTTLGVLGCVSRIAYSYVIAIASATWMVYVASTVGLLKFVPVVVCRTLMSKMVPKDEQGKVFSLLTAFEALSPLVGSSVVTVIFTATADWWPGFFSMVGAYSSLVPMVLLVWVDYNMRCDEQFLLKRNAVVADDVIGGDDEDADSCATVEDDDEAERSRN